MSETKYLSIGTVIKFEDGDRFIQIDNVNLKELVQLLKAHGEKYLENLGPKEIMAGQKLKKDDPNRIPRLSISLFTPSEKAPSFIEKNLAIKKIQG